MEHLTKDQLARLLAQAKANSQRDFLALKLGYEHGLRISEVCSLTPNHFRDGYLTIQRLKGSLQTTQPVIPSTWVELEPYMQPFRGRQRIFTIQRSQLSKLFERYAWLAGIPAHLRHFHILKSSCGMHSIAIAGIENLRQFLGHKCISSTGAYLKVSDPEASAAVQPALLA